MKALAVGVWALAVLWVWLCFGLLVNPLGLRLLGVLGMVSGVLFLAALGLSAWFDSEPS